MGEPGLFRSQSSLPLCTSLSARIIKQFPYQGQTIKGDSTETPNHSNVRNVLELFNISVTSGTTRENKGRRGPFSVPIIIKSSIESQNSEFMRSYISQRRLSHVVHVENLSGTRITCRFTREFTQERSPTPAPHLNIVLPITNIQLSPEELPQIGLNCILSSARLTGFHQCLIYKACSFI